MKKLLTCRRTFIALTALILLTILGLANKIDVSMSIASVAIGLAGANSYEASRRKTTDEGNP